MQHSSKSPVAAVTTVLLLVTALGGQLGAADFTRIPPRKEILAIMHKVNAWQLANPRMPKDDRNWVRATWYTGVMAAGLTAHDREFLDQALQWGRQHQWQVGTEPDGPNRLFCVETWLQLYFLKKDRAMIEPAIRWLDTSAPNTPLGAKRWYIEADNPAVLAANRTYVDALYGAVAFAMLSKATGDKKYLDMMHTFFRNITGELYDKQVGLYYRDYRYIGPRTKNGKKIFWSRGNGWVFAGIARVLDYLPKTDPARPEYVEIYKRMAAELVKRQAADGLWRPNLDDPDDVPVSETSGTGFFCFGLAWGINHGFLDRATYLPAVRKAWAGLCMNVSPEGKVLYGQQIGGAPGPVSRESSHEYVPGTFLLAGSEVYKLAGK